jgi:hypothetical protein
VEPLLSPAWTFIESLRLPTLANGVNCPAAASRNQNGILQVHPDSFIPGGMEELLHQPIWDLAWGLRTPHPSLTHVLRWDGGTIVATARARNRGGGGQWRRCDSASYYFFVHHLAAPATAPHVAASAATHVARGCVVVPQPCAARSMPGSGSYVSSHHATASRVRFGRLHGEECRAGRKQGGRGPPPTLLLHYWKLEAATARDDDTVAQSLDVEANKLRCRRAWERERAGAMLPRPQAPPPPIIVMELLRRRLEPHATIAGEGEGGSEHHTMVQVLHRRSEPRATRAGGGGSAMLRRVVAMCM